MNRSEAQALNSDAEYHAALEAAGHVLRRKADGRIDAFGMEYGYHNGPMCVRCGEAWCHHCRDAFGQCSATATIDLFPFPKDGHREGGRPVSYCRWSSMNWKCDVYVYESVYGGWVTHVAARRRIIPPIPDLPIHRLPDFGATWPEKGPILRATYPSRAHQIAHRIVLRLWGWWHRYLHCLTLNLIPLVKIGGPYDGQTFTHGSPGECASWLRWVRQMGYNVPDYAIDALMAEQKELDNA